MIYLKFLFQTNRYSITLVFLSEISTFHIDTLIKEAINSSHKYHKIVEQE
jgi:hypothetical protein